MGKLGNLYGDFRHRADLLNPVTRILSQRDVVKVERIIYLVGLKRSGLHATANWLLGKQPGAVLLNNSPLKALGWASPMSRTLRHSPLPIRVHRHYPALTLDQNGEEQASRIEPGCPLVLILFQSQALSHLTQRPLVQGIQADQETTLLLLRDPFNWSASFKAKSREPIDDALWPGLWLEYAREFAGATEVLPEALKCNYNRWLQEKGYRDNLASALELRGDEKHLGAVTRHAGGSSFDGVDFKGRAMDMQLESRWMNYREEPSYLRALEENPGLVELGLELFDLHDELREFALERKATAENASKPV